MLQIILSLFYTQALEKTNTTLRWGSDLVVSAHEGTKMQLPSHDARATPREHWGMYCTQVCSSTPQAITEFSLLVIQAISSSLLLLESFSQSSVSWTCMRFTFNSLCTCCFSAQPGMHPKLGPKPAHQQTEINPPMSQKEHIKKKRAEERKQQELEELHVSIS